MFVVKYPENPWREKFDFFLKNPEFPYFDVQKNANRGSNRLRVKIVQNPNYASTEVKPRMSAT